jgi:hypothetical protein
VLLGPDRDLLHVAQFAQGVGIEFRHGLTFRSLTASPLRTPDHNLEARICRDEARTSGAPAILFTRHIAQMTGDVVAGESDRFVSLDEVCRTCEA